MGVAGVKLGSIRLGDRWQEALLSADEGGAASAGGVRAPSLCVSDKGTWKVSGSPWVESTAGWTPLADLPHLRLQEDSRVRAEVGPSASGHWSLEKRRQGIPWLQVRACGSLVRDRLTPASGCSELLCHQGQGTRRLLLLWALALMCTHRDEENNKKCLGMGWRDSSAVRLLSQRIWFNSRCPMVTHHG